MDVLLNRNKITLSLSMLTVKELRTCILFNRFDFQRWFATRYSQQLITIASSKLEVEQLPYCD